MEWYRLSESYYNQRLGVILLHLNRVSAVYNIIVKKNLSIRQPLVSGVYYVTQCKLYICILYYECCLVLNESNIFRHSK